MPKVPRKRRRRGNAYYVPPGHTPIHFAGSEIVEFSPTDALGEALSVCPPTTVTSTQRPKEERK